MPDKDIAAAPTLSIIVPVYNEAAYVAKVLDAASSKYNLFDRL